MNRHQSLYRRVIFSLSVSAFTIHGDICSENKEKANKFRGCPESIYTYSELLGSWPDYVRTSSNELKAIPSGRPDTVFFPSLCMYYALSLFITFRLYKYFD